MSVEPTDRELLEVLGANRQAFETFYRRHVDRVIGFAARRLRQPADVADVVATTFLAVVTSAPSYDPARGEPTAWLLGIAARQIANAARKTSRETALVTRIAGHRLLDAADVERLHERIEAEEAAAAVLGAIEALKPTSREALRLVALDGLTSAQAAQVLGISPSNLRMRLTAARRALGKTLRTGPVQPLGTRSHTTLPDLQEVSNEC